MTGNSDKEGRIAALVAKRIFTLAVALSLSVACSTSGGASGHKYSKGDKINGYTPEMSGTYCGTLESTGTTSFPRAASFIVGMTSKDFRDHDCDQVLRFFRDWLAAGAPEPVDPSQCELDCDFEFNNVLVEFGNDMHAKVGYYAWAASNAAAHPYGLMDGFAVAVVDESKSIEVSSAGNPSPSSGSDVIQEGGQPFDPN